MFREIAEDSRFFPGLWPPRCLTVQKLDCVKLVHCLAGRQTLFQQRCKSLLTIPTSAICDYVSLILPVTLDQGSMKTSLVQPSFDTTTETSQT